MTGTPVVPFPGGPVSESSAAGALRNPDLLGIYCNDHLAASTGGIELVSRMVGRHRGSSYEPHLEQLLTELREEKTALRSTMAALGIPVRQYKQLASWVGEKVTRAKLNGRLLSRSPLSDVVELEFIATAVLAKRAGFETLREVAEADDRIDAALLERLINQADRQHEWLSEARREVAAALFGGRPGPASEGGGGWTPVRVRQPGGRGGARGGRTGPCATTTTAVRPHRPAAARSPTADSPP